MSKNDIKMESQFCMYCSMSLPFRNDKCGICNHPHKKIVIDENSRLLAA